MKLRHVNNILFATTVVVLLYVIAAPLVPAMVFWFESRTTSRLVQLTAQLHQPLGKVAAVPMGNRLVIPKLLLDTPINEGATLAALRTGPWRRPGGSTPNKGGNTVIAGHRYTYTNPTGVFYYLNKLQPGDEMGLFWSGKRYLYKVASSREVAATEVSIEANTTDSRLTLYTCTPLWLPKNRLVVTAELEKP